ncbi:MFS transporter [Aspergillus candidus]|uniref:MFS general substrate transporter n=1 Tax=Aspergillus candidus TaxID=41067 RepID=A0A2I2FKG6_ASPCN|nr:MFS general substrate transporter [Aspergillus candidus]PLB41102.1 MFS general substrate transporter [Aspergillus candidus]
MKPTERDQFARRHSSTLHYQTFDTPPPKGRGRPTSRQSASSDGQSNHPQSDPHDDHPPSHSPLPRMQMAVLAMISLCEQTAFNSVSPYLPDMASSFPEVEPRMVGIYVGTIATAFAIAQFVTNYFWGWLSDRVGRKPVILLGTILTAVAFVGWGFCRTLTQAIAVQALMGIVNGNQGLVSTCLGEITDRSNQSQAFTYLPVLYGIGAITGPLLGGLLIFPNLPWGSHAPNPYPYLAPNLVVAGMLVVDFVLTAIFMEECLDDAEAFPKLLHERVHALYSWIWQFVSYAKRARFVEPPHIAGYRPMRASDEAGSDHDSELDSASEASNPQDTPRESLTSSEILNRDTVLLLATYLIFALCNVAFSALFPIFSQAAPPTGRGLTPQEIGLAQGFSGLVTILFQVCLFGKLREKMGNRWSYRMGLLGFVISFILMPFIGYKGQDGKAGHITAKTVWMAVELCVVLLIKTIASVGGLTSALLLITNSAPDHAVLGALNGLAQTLSAAGRAVGPFLSGGLFSLATRIKKGEALAFGVFAVVSFVGFVMSFGIRSRSLEADGYESGSDSDNYKSDDDDENEAPAP